MQRIAIVGLGLIGSSIGIGLRRWSAENVRGGQPALDVIGFDSNLDRQSQAKKIGAVDRTEWELRKVVENADLIVLAAPVLALKEIMSDIAPLLKHGAAVTDVASTKSEVLAWANELLPRTVSFVGGHPMAGKESSIEGADGDLFRGATWCVCPSVQASDESIRPVLGMVNALGAEPYFVDPNEHDAYVAGISHLPFVASSALMNVLAADASWRDMKSLTASGFRDMTRLASGSPEMHRDVVMTNRAAVERWLDAYVAELQDFRTKLTGSDDDVSQQLLAFFTNGRDRRAEWAVQTSREAELLGGTGNDSEGDGFSGQMGRMLFGGFMRKPRVQKDQAPKTPVQ
ncbi:MAG: prephenate dehydrogenase/arogenate dehydrogenase family protein [Thermomicrobiales bacterium]|nr:MAG: prephenate dehydrogenase/arogenate dehydrogenase family protein [Thermomicrobiales bacterium]